MALRLKAGGRSQALALVALTVVPLGASAGPCPTYDPGISLGRVVDASITEISGMVASRRQPGVLWVHNDSGDAPRIYALGTDGALRLTVTFPEARAKDWEDMAMGPGPLPGRDYLYLADIGDNREIRPSVVVYRVPEPVLAASADESPTTRDVAEFERLEMVYPDQPRDAETLLVDPFDGALYVVTKDRSGPAYLYRYPPPLRPDETVVLEQLAEIPGTENNQWWQATPTGGDIAADGSRLALRLYKRIWIWLRAPGASLVETLEAPACLVPHAAERQGEAIAFEAGGTGYLTIGEGARSPIWSFQPAPEASPTEGDPG